MALASRALGTFSRTQLVSFQDDFSSCKSARSQLQTRPFFWRSQDFRRNKVLQTNGGRTTLRQRAVSASVASERTLEKGPENVASGLSGVSELGNGGLSDEVTSSNPENAAKSQQGFSDGVVEVSDFEETPSSSSREELEAVGILDNEAEEVMDVSALKETPSGRIQEELEAAEVLDDDSDDVVEVSVLEETPSGRSREELAKELEAVGISDANFSTATNAEKLAAIMSKNGLDPSDFTQEYEAALAKDRAERAKRNVSSQGGALFERYGDLEGVRSKWQQERGAKNRALVAWNDFMRKGSRFTAERGMTWPSMIFGSGVLFVAVAFSVWFRSFVWQKWEAQKLEREREERILRLNKLKHMGRTEEVEQAAAVEKPPAVVSLAEIKEQMLASQGVPEAEQSGGGNDETDLRVFGDEDDVMLMEEDGEFREGGMLAWLTGRRQKIEVKAAPTKAESPPDPEAQEKLREEWERILEKEKQLEAGRFYEVVKPEQEDKAPSEVGKIQQARRFSKVAQQNGRAQKEVEPERDAGKSSQDSIETPAHKEAVRGVGDEKTQNQKIEKEKERQRVIPDVRKDRAANAVASNASVPKPPKSQERPFSSSPQLQATQRRIEARVSEMTSPRDKAAVLLALQSFAADVGGAAPGTVDGVAFRGWFDKMAAEIAKLSVPEIADDRRSPATENGQASHIRQRKSLEENGAISRETVEEISGVTQNGRKAPSEGEKPSTSYTKEEPLKSRQTENGSANGRPTGGNLEEATAAYASMNGNGVQNGRPKKVKVTRTVRKRKVVSSKPQPEEEEGPNTITGEHPIFGAQYKDGTTEFERRVQRDFEAEVAADPELRRIRAEIVLNGEEGRNEWDGLELWEKKLYHSCEEKHFKRMQAKVRAYIKKEAKSRGVDYDAVMGENRDRPRWLTDSPEDEIQNEGDPAVQMDMMRDILGRRMGLKPDGRQRFDMPAIPKEDLDALEAEERRVKAEVRGAPPLQAVESSSGVVFPDESIPPDQFSSTLKWAETIREEEIEAEVTEVKEDVSQLSDFSETSRWAEELRSRDVITEEEILQAHIDENTVKVSKARLRKKRKVGDPVTPNDAERLKAKAKGGNLMEEWDMTDFARELGVDANAPDTFSQEAYDKAGEHIKERVRALLPQISEMKKAADKMGPNEFLRQHGSDLGLEVSVPEAKARMTDEDRRWWVNLPEVQVILLNKSGKYQLLALDLTAEVTGNCYVIGFQDKQEAAWFRDWLSKVPHHATHSPVVQPIGPPELEEYAKRTSSQILVLKRGSAEFKPNMSTEQMEFMLMGLAEDSTVTAFLEKMLPELEEMQRKQVEDFMVGDPELVKMMQEAVGSSKK